MKQRFARAIAVAALLVLPAPVVSGQAAREDDPLAHGSLRVQQRRIATGAPMTAAQQRVAWTVVDSLVAALKEFPEVSSPHSYDAVVGYHVEAPPSGRLSVYGVDVPVARTTVSVGFFWYYVNANTKGVAERVPETPYWTTVRVNDPVCVFALAPITPLKVDSRFRSRPTVVNRQGAEIRFSDPIDPKSAVISDDASGWNGCVVLTHSARPLWKSVSQQQWIESALAEAQKDKYAQGAVPDLRAELAALSAAERAAPAYTCPGSQRHSSLCGQADPYAHEVVTLNPDFFDRTLPAAAPQVISIESFNAPDMDPAQAAAKGTTASERQANEITAKLNNLLNRIRENLDRKTLEGLLRP